VPRDPLAPGFWYSGPPPCRYSQPGAGRSATECEHGRGLSTLAGTPIADYSLSAGRCWPAVEARRLSMRRRGPAESAWSGFQRCRLPVPPPWTGRSTAGAPCPAGRRPHGIRSSISALAWSCVSAEVSCARDGVTRARSFAGADAASWPLHSLAGCPPETAYPSSKRSACFSPARKRHEDLLDPIFGGF
jgi:hypothetical protein